MRKAGIVVGITFILVACILFWVKDILVNEDNQKEVVTQSKQEEPLQVESSKGVDTTNEAPPTSDIQSTKEGEQVDSENEVGGTQSSPISISEGMTFLELSDSEIGQPVVMETEIMVVSRKKVILMDYDTGGTGGKQLVYSVEVMGNNNTRLSLHLNGRAYSTISLGDKLKVEYAIHRNDRGVNFPVVISVEEVQ